MATEPKEGDLRLWWIPQVPMAPFHVNVESAEQAIFLYNTLANYDIFQFENNIKPDYCNAGGLEVFEDGEWSEYENGDAETIDELARNEAA